MEKFNLMDIVSEKVKRNMFMLSYRIFLDETRS